MEILICAAEASGDMYAAQLARALTTRTGAHIFGLGGEAMRDAGVELVADYHDIATMGLGEVLGKIPRALSILRALQREARQRKPALAVLVDAPGMNFPLSRRLFPLDIRMAYFISPQVWAWRSGRVKAIRERIERMFVIFPFEVDFYERAGVPVEYVGHPLVDSVGASSTREEFAARHGLDPQRPILTILPGSRHTELSFHLPPIAQACAGLARDFSPQFVLAVARNLVDSEFRGFGAPGLPATFVQGETYDALAASDCAIVSSGTATVEAALLGTPMVVVYRVSKLSGAILRRMIRTPHVAMVNLIAGRQVVPELIQEQFTPSALEAAVRGLLAAPEPRENMRQQLRAIRAKLGPGGTIERAAGSIARMLEQPQGKASNSPPLVS
jgi:lipid-A-disaccharide synthase